MLQELAVQLLSKQIEDPAWNQSFSRYFESLPAWGTLYSKEIWKLDPDHMALFQEPYLVRTCHTRSDLPLQTSLNLLSSQQF